MRQQFRNSSVSIVSAWRTLVRGVEMHKVVCFNMCFNMQFDALFVHPLTSVLIAIRASGSAHPSLSSSRNLSGTSRKPCPPCRTSSGIDTRCGYARTACKLRRFMMGFAMGKACSTANTPQTRECSPWGSVVVLLKAIIAAQGVRSSLRLSDVPFSPLSSISRGNGGNNFGRSALCGWRTCARHESKPR